MHPTDHMSIAVLQSGVQSGVQSGCQRGAGNR